MAGGGAVGNHGHRLAGSVRGVHLDFDIKHRGEAAQTLSANAQVIDAYSEGFRITVADLLVLYLNENAIHLPLKELLERVFRRRESPGGWQEDFYAYEDPDDFDSVSFNRTANRFFSDILETIEEEGEEEGVSFKDFTDMTSRILKKFRQEEYYFLPKDAKKETRFKIEGFKFPEMKVVVTLSKGLKQTTITVSEQNFYNLLYQPSLFSLDEI